MSRILLLILACTALLAAAEGPRDSGWIPRERALAAAAMATVEHYPDADEVLLDSARQVAYEADGTSIQYQEEWLKVLTEAGRRGRTSLESFYTIPYQQDADCRVPLVEIVKPDGTVVPINVAANSEVKTSSDSMGANIYNPNDKVIRINIPNLAVGDVLHFVMYDRIVRARMAGTFSDQLGFEEQRPIIRKAVEISAPPALPLAKIVLRDPLGETVTASRADTADRLVYRWVGQDVPRFFPEPAMPAPWSLTQRVLVSTIPDWQTVSRWYAELCEPHLAADDALRAAVVELTAGCVDDAAKIHALFAFVAQKIRYMGITTEDAAPGYEPHDVTDTFTRKHGVCRDKAALLAAMLRLAGLEGYPVLIHTGPRKDPEVATPWFNHAIVAVKRDGKYVLMDPTDETSTESLPSYLCDKSFLVAAAEGEGLLTSEVIPADGNLVSIVTRAALDGSGALRAESVITFEGINDRAYRGWFARVKPEQRRQLFEGVVKNAAAGATLERFILEPANLTDADAPLVARLTWSAEDLPIADDVMALVRPPLLGTRVGYVTWALGDLGLVKRRFPLALASTCGVREELRLVIAPVLGRAGSLPGYEKIGKNGLLHIMSALSTDDGMEIESLFRLDRLEYPPEAYATLKDALRVIERNQRKAIILARDPAALSPDTEREILESTLTIDLVDAHSWTETRHVRQRLLTYAGKKRHGEIKLVANEAWDEAELLFAKVTTPDGKVHEIDPKEINLMDAPWTANAKRYPATRILVASLPALVEGCMVDFTHRVKRTGRPAFALGESFGGPDPVREQQVIVRVPQDPAFKALHTRLTQANAAVSQTRSEVDGKDVLVWKAVDLPGGRREQFLPPDWAWCSHLAVGTATWKTWADAVRPVLERAIGQAEMVSAKALALAPATLEPRERIRRLRDFVAVTIRQAGPGLNDMPLAAVSGADTVLADGYGNQADQAVLLAALLTAAGFDPSLVLAGRTQHHPDLRHRIKDLPGPWFDQVLVRVADPAGTVPLLLGTNDQYDLLTACDLAGTPGLDLTTGAFLDEVVPDRARSQTEQELVFAPSGDVVYQRRNHFFDRDFGQQRRFYSEMTPEERKRHHQTMAQRISALATDIGQLQTDFEQEPGSEILRQVRIPGYAERSGDFLYFTVDTGLGTIVPITADSRTGPLLLDQRLRYGDEITIHLPEGYEPALIPTSPGTIAPLEGSIDITSEMKDGTIILRYTVDRLPLLLPADRYDELLNLHRRLTHPRMRTVVLKRVKQQ